MPAGPLATKHAGSGRSVTRRRLGLAWLALWALVFAVLGVWGLGLRGAERAVDRWHARWEERLAEGEALVAAERHEEAARFLEAFDAEHPAVFVKHGLDRQRERGLELLGACYTALGERERALATFERLVAFDPRNAHSRWLLARSQDASGRSEPALESLRELLAIHPTHLPGVEARIRLLRAGGLHAEAVAAFEEYLDAWLLAPVTLTFGAEDVVLELEVLVDGSPQSVSAPLELPAGWRDGVGLCTWGHSFELGSLRIVPPAFAGDPVAAEPVRVAGWGRTPGEGGGGPRFPVHDREASTFFSQPVRLPAGGARIELELTLFKALTEDLWEAARASYVELGLEHELERVERRVQVGGCLEAGTLFGE